MERSKYATGPQNTGGGVPLATPAVDSGDLATIAGAGVVGLILLLALTGRLCLGAGQAARQDSTGGWIPLAFLVCLTLDALTRASFTGFPTAFLALLIVGMAIAIATAAAGEEAASAGEPAFSARG